MEIVNLVCRDRRSLEYSESGVSEDSLMGLTRSPILACHIAVVTGRSAPREAIPFIVGTHSVKAIAACQLSFEVIDVRELDIRHGALIVIAILVEPGDWIRTRTAIGGRVVLRNGRSATGRRGLCVQQPARHRCNKHGRGAKP